MAGLVYLARCYFCNCRYFIIWYI